MSFSVLGLSVDLLDESPREVAAVSDRDVFLIHHLINQVQSVLLQ